MDFKREAFILFVPLSFALDLKVTVQQAKEDKSLEEAGMGPHNREEVVKMSANQSNGGIDGELNVFCQIKETHFHGWRCAVRCLV